jgi:toxin ParE1/3/4
MAQVIWTSPALLDLDDIADYIAFHNLVAAKNLVETIFNKVERLELFSESGRKPPELETLNYREVIVNPCRIFYKIEQDKIYILHVMRQEQQLRVYLFTEPIEGSQSI